MNNPADQPARETSGLQQRAAKAGARVRELGEELEAEREMRDVALVELYEQRHLAGLTVDQIAALGKVTRSRLLGIVGSA